LKHQEAMILINHESDLRRRVPWWRLMLLRAAYCTLLRWVVSSVDDRKLLWLLRAADDEQLKEMVAVCDNAMLHRLLALQTTNAMLKRVTMCSPDSTLQWMADVADDNQLRRIIRCADAATVRRMTVVSSDRGLVRLKALTAARQCPRLRARKADVSLVVERLAQLSGVEA